MNVFTPMRVTRLGRGLALGAGLWLAVAGAGRAAEEDYHAFTDAKGTVFKAKVLSVMNETATLQRADGDKVELLLAALSKADQAYIMEGLIKQFSAHGRGVFEISAVTDKTAATPTKIDGGTQMDWQETYRFTMKNQTLWALSGLEARIILFKALQLPDVPGVVQSEITLVGQTRSLERFEPSGKLAWQTDPVPMLQIQANDGGYFPAPQSAIHAKTDKLLAVWVRIYDRNNYLVQEWCSVPAMAKPQPWDAAWAQANYRPVPTRRP
ncbi:MAG TPA: hypothetical protein VHC95_03930 [Opitutales bacterium]|nr:hypothetical protein [Opitutales bacterium]